MLNGKSYTGHSWVYCKTHIITSYSQIVYKGILKITFEKIMAIRAY